MTGVTTGASTNSGVTLRLGTVAGIESSTTAITATRSDAGLATGLTTATGGVTGGKTTDSSVDATTSTSAEITFTTVGGASGASAAGATVDSATVVGQSGRGGDALGLTLTGYRIVGGKPVTQGSVSSGGGGGAPPMSRTIIHSPPHQPPPPPLKHANGSVHATTTVSSTCVAARGHGGSVSAATIRQTAGIGAANSRSCRAVIGKTRITTIIGGTADRHSRRRLADEDVLLLFGDEARAAPAPPLKQLSRRQADEEALLLLDT